MMLKTKHILSFFFILSSLFVSAYNLTVNTVKASRIEKINCLKVKVFNKQDSTIITKDSTIVGEKEPQINSLNVLEENKLISFITNDYINSLTDKIVVKAKNYIGTPYRYGGSSFSGIDCSSLMQNIFIPVGISLPRISRDQANIGIQIKKEELLKGDLVFFNTSRGISHVGVVSEIIDGVTYFIHASSSKGVIQSSLNDTYWAGRYITARRIVYVES